jgi:tetratricopeptide (TPR) repeat protein
MDPGKKHNPFAGQRPAWLAAALLAGVTFAVFAGALDAGFVNFDDADYVSANLNVVEGLSASRVGWAFTTSWNANWHPLTWLSLQLDASFWGRDPRGYHLTNILLHAANAALLFFALRALTRCYWRSCAVALLFAVHPLRAESVAWISERKDVLSILFGFLALGAYARYVELPTVRRYVLVAVLFALSLMAKPTLVTLPFLLLVLDWWPLGRWDRGRLEPLIREKIPLLAVAAVSAAITLLAQSKGGAIRDLRSYPVLGRVGNAAVSYAAYLSQTFWPVNLSPFYTYPDDGHPLWKAAGAALVLVALTIVAVGLRRRAPYVLAGWLWYVGTLVPVIGLVQVGHQAMADRYTYFSQIGILIAICWGIAEVAGERSTKALVACALAASVLAILTVRQVRFWHDSVTLWHHALEANGSTTTNMLQYASAIEDQGYWHDAADFYRKIMARDERDPLPRSNLANLLSEEGNQEEAEKLLHEALALDPNCALARTNLGNVLFRQGKFEEAIGEHKEALRLAPNLKGAWYNLGLAEAKLGHAADAEKGYADAVRLDPAFAKARSALGSAMFARGAKAEGLAHLRKAVHDEPRFAEGRVNLGKALAESGDLGGAARELDEATRLAPGLATAWYNLGLVRGRQGNFHDAIEGLLKAVECEPDSAAYREVLDRALQALRQSGQSDQAERIEQRLRQLGPRAKPPATGNGSPGSQ